MVAGCLVLASDLPAHNEIIPDSNLLPPISIQDWVSELTNIHADWRAAGGVPRHPSDELMEHVKNILSPESQGKSLAEAYDESYLRSKIKLKIA